MNTVQSLVDKGLVEKVGYGHDGQAVYANTPLGNAIADALEASPRYPNDDYDDEEEEDDEDYEYYDDDDEEEEDLDDEEDDLDDEDYDDYDDDLDYDEGWEPGYDY